jgi:F0F1-type ATP synthase assembly protein I
MEERPPPPAPEARRATDRSWGQWAGAGFEFAASVLLFFFLGSWADATWGTQPWMTVAGALLGVVVGMYLLIRQALRPSWFEKTERAKSNPTSTPPNLKRP